MKTAYWKSWPENLPVLGGNGIIILTSTFFLYIIGLRASEYENSPEEVNIQVMACKSFGFEKFWPQNGHHSRLFKNH